MSYSPLLLDATADGLAQAIAAVRSGLVVALPTDTVYALVASTESPGASARLFAAKGRGRDRPLPVLCSDRNQAERVALLRGRVAALARVHWPGPLTLVLPRHPSFSADLGEDSETVGVRVSDDTTTRIVAAAAGPLASTSANLHGSTELLTAAAVAETFPSSVAVVVRSNRESGGTASTVVSGDASGNVVEVLREGPILVDVDDDRWGPGKG